MTSAFHVYFGPEALAATPRVRRIGAADCFAALSEGFDDFFSMPTYPVFVGVFYAVAGIALFAMTSFGNALHLGVSARRRLCADRPVRRRRPLRDEPPARTRAHGQRARRVHGRSLARAALDSRVRPHPARDLRRLDVRRRAHLCLALRTQSAGRGDPIPPRRPDHRPRLDADRRGRVHRLLLRRARACDQRRLIPADARPRRGPRAGARDVAARDPRQSARGRALGPDRRGGAHPRLIAAVLRPRRRPAGAWPCDLAPLPQGDRARPGPRASDRSSLAARTSPETRPCGSSGFSSMRWTRFGGEASRRPRRVERKTGA